MSPLYARILDNLQKSGELVTGPREDTHGDVKENYVRISKLWSAYLGYEILPWDVCSLLALVKVARMAGGSYNRDDYLDAQSYFAMSEALISEEHPEIPVEAPKKQPDIRAQLAERAIAGGYSLKEFWAYSGARTYFVAKAFRSLHHLMQDVYYVCRMVPISTPEAGSQWGFMGIHLDPFAVIVRMEGSGIPEDMNAKIAECKQALRDAAIQGQG